MKADALAGTPAKPMRLKLLHQILNSFFVLRNIYPDLMVDIRIRNKERVDNYYLEKEE